MEMNGVIRSLYRCILKASRCYGEGASKRNLPAKREIERLNAVLRYQQLQVPSGGSMNQRLAVMYTQQMFRKNFHCNSKSVALFVEDAFAILKTLHKRGTSLQTFPFSSASEEITEGCKVEVESRFLEVRTGWYHYDYKVKVTNMTDKHLQIVSEHLNSVDENLDKKELAIGLYSALKTKNPALKAGDSFEFTKRFFCRTPLGSLSGSYLLFDVDSGEVSKARFAPILLSVDA